MTTAIIIIGVVVVFLFIMNLLVNKEIKIECNISIDKPIKEVFDYLKMTKNQDYFSTWNMMDPDMKKEYVGDDGKVGFVYKWDSIKNKNVGAGEQEIKLIEEGKSILYELRFSRPMKNIANSQFKVDSENTTKTKVTWLFFGPTKFPMSLLKSIFEKMLRKDLEKGLKNLKTVLEKQ